MRVTGLTLWAHDLALAEPYSYAGGTLSHITSLILRMRTDTGLEGWGESCPLGATYQPAHWRGGVAAMQEMGAALIGVEATPNALGAAMAAQLEGHAYAKALVDIAAWDLMGKRAGLPLATLLGGARQDPVPSYYAIAPGPEEQVVATVRRKVAEGFTNLQVKIGAGHLSDDIAVVRAAVAAAGGKARIAADANRAMRREDVIHLSAALCGVPVALEQPCATPEEMRALKGRLHHPLYWDESTTSPATVLEALGRGYCDGLGMKLTRVGGISAMLGIRDMAVAAGVPLSVDDSWGGDIIAAACTHVGATVPPHVFRGTWIAQPYIGAHYGAEGIDVTSGHIALPGGPGLGITPDPAIFGTPVAEFGA